MTERVVTSSPDEFVEIAVRKMERHKISALPVIDLNRKVIGMVTSGDLNKLLKLRSSLATTRRCGYPQTRY